MSGRKTAIRSPARRFGDDPYNLGDDLPFIRYGLRHSRADVEIRMMLTNDLIGAAQAAWHKWKVPASVSLAQWIIESGWGKHEPPGSNNPFGIKAGINQPFVEAVTREFVHGRYVTTTARFAKFGSMVDAFDAHARLLATHPAYRHAMQASRAEEFAERLQGVYATDPNYGHILVSAMRKYGLEQYDA
jgi:flagellum-specific peptidoglycan hydrolase FlgJ